MSRDDVKAVSEALANLDKNLKISAEQLNESEIKLNKADVKDLINTLNNFEHRLASKRASNVTEK